MRLGSFEIVEPLPALRQPHVLAVLNPWFDVGRIGTLSLERIQRHLGCAEIGRLARPGHFFDFTRYRPESYVKDGRRELIIPNTTIRYTRRQQAPDLIYLNMMEPHAEAEEYIDSVIGLLKFFEVKSYSLIGGMAGTVWPFDSPRELPYTRRQQAPDFHAEAEDWSKDDGLEPDSEIPFAQVLHSTYEGMSSITDLVQQGAIDLGIDSETYLVHLPRYLRLKEDFAGVARLMEVLCQRYDLPEALIDEDKGKRQYDALEEEVAKVPGGSDMVSQLEEQYDRWKEEQIESLIPLSSEVEQFLQQLR